MAVSLGAPRVLLRRLREIMEEPESAQGQLDKIVVQIAANMVSEVCSIYVRRSDGAMELTATEGLNPDAVHKTHLARGEGLVGRISEQAEPLNLTDAQSHPAFSYRPETGEAIYHSFLGVPILRGGRTLGVVTVQNKTQRNYSEEEVEALQTTAMVLAELVGSRELGAGTDDPQSAVQRIQGVSLSEGIAIGHVVLHEPRVVVSELVAENPDEEKHRLRAAVEELRAAIERMLGRGEMAGAGEHREVLETYQMLANDRGWFNRMKEAVATGLTAEAAVERVQNDTRARMIRQRDPYLRERFHDLDDLSNRLLRLLTGHTMTATNEELPDDAILVARTMGPAELLDYDLKRLRGLVLEESGFASHVAIVARALDVAAVGQITGVRDLMETGDDIIVDAESGEVHMRPSPDLVSAYVDKVQFRAKRQAQYAKLRDRPAVTRDGQAIQLLINAGLLVDLPHLEESGADGIGLFRTELQFMISATLPRLDQQTETYRAVMDAAGDKPVVFRSLDIGGDKVLPYLRHAQEANPALGWRAIRMALDRPVLLRTQIRALMRAAEGREIRVMLPMISDVEEYRTARTLIEVERSHLRTHGHVEPSKVLVGAMVEVPALLWQLDRLLPEVDFISIGSNDLLQFMFAADRSNIRVADRFDDLSPAVMRALRSVVEEADRFEVPVTLCGEMAGKPLEAMALLGLGLRSISMAPASLGPVKDMILSLDLERFEHYLTGILDSETVPIREALIAYAEANDIPI